jgi:hypothetical protein
VPGSSTRTLTLAALLQQLAVDPEAVPAYERVAAMTTVTTWLAASDARRERGG